MAMKKEIQLKDIDTKSFLQMFNDLTPLGVAKKIATLSCSFPERLIRKKIELLVSKGFLFAHEGRPYQITASGKSFLKKEEQKLQGKTNEATC